MGGKSLIDEQRLALAHGMGAYDGMRRLRKNLTTVVVPYQHIGRTIDVLARMRSREPLEIGLHARRQRIVGCILARKQRISADRRHGGIECCPTVAPRRNSGRAPCGFPRQAADRERTGPDAPPAPGAVPRPGGYSAAWRASSPRPRRQYAA